MQKSMKTGILWNAGGNILYLASQWIVTVMVTRINGFNDAGILALAMSIASTLQTISLFGIRNFQVSDIDNEFHDSTYVGFRQLTSFLSLLICVIFSLFTSNSAKQFLAIQLYMIFRLAESFSDVFHGIAQKNDRLDIAGKSLAIKSVLLSVAFFPVYIYTKNLNLALFLMALSSVITTVFYDYIAVRRLASFKLFDDFALCVALAKKTLPLCIYMFLFSSIATIPKMVLEDICNEDILGAYSSIFAPASLIQAATAYIYNPFAPVFALHHRNRDYSNFYKTFIKIFLILILMSAALLVASAFLGEFALVLVFGEQIREYAYLLTPILIVTILLAALGFLCMLAIVLRDFSGLILGCTVGSALSLILSYVFISKDGVAGTNYALIIASLAASLIITVSIVIKTNKNKV